MPLQTATPEPACLCRSTPEPSLAIVACGKVGRWHHADVVARAWVRRGAVLGEYRALGVRFEVRAPDDGWVEHWLVQPDQRVDYGQPLLQFRAQPHRA